MGLMGFSTMPDSFGQVIGIIILVIAFWSYVVRKFMANNPVVKDAAKKAVANKAIDVIGRWLK